MCFQSHCMQSDTTGISFLRFSADIIPKADAQERLQEAVHRNVAMNETRTILLRYKHGNPTNDSSSKLLSESSAYTLPSLLQSQTRVKQNCKGPPQVKKDVTVEMSTPLTIMSYRPDKADNLEGRKPLLKGQPSSRKGNTQKAVLSTSQAKSKGRPNMMSFRGLYPDPLSDADKSYLARISELSQLELETVKLEKTKKSKRKKFPE